MGLFGAFSKKSSVSMPAYGNLTAHLNQVDELYMRAFAIKSMRQLQEFLSRECAAKVSRVVFGSGSRYFGAPKFRTTVWTVVSSEGDIIKFLKDVKFDSVRVGSVLSVGVAENYQEYWTVNKSGKSPVVIDISSA